MVLQNKHKRLASARWNKARGNPTKQYQGRNLGVDQQRNGGDHSNGEEEDRSEDDEDTGEDDEGKGEVHGGEEEEEEDDTAFPTIRSRPSERPNASSDKPLPQSSQSTEKSFARRPLKSNEDRYAEPEVDPYAEVEPTSDDEREAHNLSILMKHRLDLSTSPLPELRDDSTDPSIDHALKLRMQTRSGGKKVLHLSSASSSTSSLRTNKPAGQGRVVPGEDSWDQASMEEMNRERAKADAISDVKARLLSAQFQRSNAPSPSLNNRPTYKSKIQPPSSSATKNRQVDDVDDFLNSL
ncbi:hypothetical protein [Phaffia rhodozyma]|uniref:Uncharacterized protein n=1 Tax=Phaffia rhodozyma TaxID=264483 RepID=A0A0F7SLW9_PHARH|nr:hypothetical protein [Phaffia rhodozyma]